MKKNPRIIGDEHVKNVYQALLKYLKNEPIDYYPKTVTQTVLYITTIYPNIKSVENKFDTNNPDLERDLTLILNDNQVKSVNLFIVRKGSRIQPKNPGAKSFFSKYFLSESMQLMFNRQFEIKYQNFLSELVRLKSGDHYINDLKELKKNVSRYFPKFSHEINPYRDMFLYNLRELCFELLKDYYNDKSEGFYHAYNVFFMTEDINIVTSYGKTQTDVNVEQFNPGIPQFSDIQIYKSGKNTVGIKYGEVALTLRFKFESSPTSSIKLAASYDKFPDEFENEETNKVTAGKMQYLIDNHKYSHNSNSSNAIGKCHEAITYFYFLKEFPNVSQVEPDECIQLMGKYYSLVKPEVLEKLFHSTSTLIPVIKEGLHKKYNDFQIVSIELVPESYINDKLDTGDLQLLLIVNKEYIVEKISLKALAKRNGKITTKNPGIGTILGPTYFNIGTMEPVVNEVKSKFHIGELNHREGLEVLAAELGAKLKDATNEQLKRGIENLLGKAMMAVTFYNENISICKCHSKIDGDINVYMKKPTAIQNTLAWNNDSEAINLRVKYSRGQGIGWSTIKLTSEYQIK